jgi:hypothetical protein
VNVREENQLRGLVAVAWPHRGTSELRERIEEILLWDEMRALARGELDELRTYALFAVEAELRRRQLIWLLRESYPVAG